MERTRGFIGLVILSILAMACRLQQVFFQKVTTLHLQLTGDVEIDKLILESQKFTLNQAEFYQNNINKWLTILLLLLLIGVLICYLKGKILQAKWLYLSYIVVQFLHAIYRFVGFNMIVNSINFEDVRQFTVVATNFKFYGSIVLFVVYIAIILISLYRDVKGSELSPV
ncbi:hypothetical protein ACTGX8_06965 [Streptococcus suis]|jgi:hypothetical protein|uniref:hypothetical protein n=1 Tax=Streptococcus parasuis TaxID=1501662 RepID=UPI001C1F34BB|nr:hypothetical protein [Streptococcus parasuis]MDG4524820.1 hypothetical protein [Streptococcus suis]QWV85742.1 hypothetical protein KQ224_06475 [Streptococcus parasuis]ULL20181.1 hypothetical protein D2A30_00305 [Streptococcus suis]HEM3617008.1 hypothetical protein [Streptococcus suis]HEM3654419.1 hypothetical protein [Streptococcus suis]